MKKIQYAWGIIILAWLVWLVYDMNKPKISLCVDRTQRTVNFKMSRMGVSSCGNVQLGENLTTQEGRTIFYVKTIDGNKLEFSIYCSYRKQTVATKTVEFSQKQLVIA